ncbi:MAG TPA: FIST C-terminal domain-containing protein [Haliscomenobacter sp.]|nr:FIST C-terminal domain-containing protein [Haliscomenobacter sp.]
MRWKSITVPWGGWDEFGRDRTITRSHKNVLYEIDGKNALDLYKEYLGPFSDELPGSALLFPISLKTPELEQKLVRTILTIDEEQKSMTFAGNMPEGAIVRLMKANFDKLTAASAESARQIICKAAQHKIELAILVSCVGRKLVLQSRTEEEVWAVRDILGEDTAITGFYSYGELSPFNPSGSCELHNQTMTITGFFENI